LNFRIRRVWVVEPPFTLIKFRSRYSTQSSRSLATKNPLESGLLGYKAK